MKKDKQDIHILIVDDEESIRFTFKMFLQREGYGKITAASTLEEALFLINEERFDLIISDIVLEDASGTDLLKHIQNTGIQCPVVLITGFPHLSTAAHSVRYGAFDYISKPVNKETLLRFVHQALQHWCLEQEKNALRLENERYRRHLEVILRSVSDGIITVDRDMSIVQINDARSFINKKKTVDEHHVECVLASGEKRMVGLTAAPLRDDKEEFDGAVIIISDTCPNWRE